MMVDGESHENVSGPTVGAPPNRDKRPNDAVIEGEIAASETGKAADADREAAGPAEPATAAREATAESPPPQPPPPPPPPAKAGPLGTGRALAAGAVGGAVVAALAAAAGVYLFPPKANLSEADANRLAALESQDARDSAAISGLDKRLAALEGAHAAAALATVEKRVAALEASGAGSNVAGFDKRLGALEAANAAEGPKIDAGSKAVQTLSGDVKTLRADIDAARGEIPAIAARVAKLEGGASTADLTAIASRVDKLESTLGAPKSETRVAPEKPSAANNPAPVAIVAAAIRDKLNSGASFPAELAALAALGVDPAELTPLKALSDGGPTDQALAASFEAVEPKVLAAVAPKETGGIGERLLAHFRGLVQIRNLGETAGDDPQALTSQIVARLERGDLAGALAAFAKLPEPARQAASAWDAEAARKQAAVAAVQAIREAAVARLAQSAKP